MKTILCFLILVCSANLCVTSQNKNYHLDTLSLEKLADSSFVKKFNGDYKRALEINLRLLDSAIKYDNAYFLHKGYSLLGYNYLSQRDTLKAQEAFEKSEVYAKESNYDKAIARTYLDIANTYAMDKAFLSKSYNYFDKSINLYTFLNDSTSLASVHYYYLEAAMRFKDLNKANIQINKIKTYIPYINDDNFCEISVNSQIANYQSLRGNYELADYYFKLVIEDSKKKEFYQELEKTYNEYSDNLFREGKLTEAYEARKEYEYYLKKNEAARTSEEIKVYTAKFEVDKYKDDALKANMESKYLAQIAESNTQRSKILTVFSIVLVVIFIYLLYIISKKKLLVVKLKDQNHKYLEAKQEAESLARSKSKFLSTVSHELRTPLYGVIGLSSILLEDPKINHQKENLRSLKFSADYLLALINDVLQINKLDSNAKTVEKTTFCIGNLIRTMVASFEYKRKENNNQVSVELGEGMPDLIGGNQSHLSQILMNIIGNAHKFTRNGDIHISAIPKNITEDELDITFIVKDTGIGIAKDKQQSIFGEFSQITGSDPSGEGTGLGLSIVTKLLKQLDSKIYIDSELGEGTTFSFTLHFDLIEQKVSGKFTPNTIFINTSILEGKKVLIVDDNKINRVVTQKILERVKTICEQATNGEEAVKMIKNNDYDLVLMDVNMPIKDGMQATKEVREFDETIPIIALTAVEIGEIKDKILASGMNDIIVKPYSNDEFHQTIMKNLNNHSVNKAV